MKALTKARIRSEEWKIVLERLDRVNVFIFPMLKFKKWNSFWAPACTLSHLKRSYYLLRLCLGEFLWESNLQLITKNQIVSFSISFFIYFFLSIFSFFFLLSFKTMKILHAAMEFSGSVSLWDETDGTMNAEGKAKSAFTLLKICYGFYLHVDLLEQEKGSVIDSQASNAVKEHLHCVAWAPFLDFPSHPQ